MNVNKTAPAPPPGTKSATGSKEPPAKGFDALLALHSDEARTAIAEGHKEKPGDDVADAATPKRENRGRHLGHERREGLHLGHARREAREAARAEKAPAAPAVPASETPAVTEPVTAAPVAEEPTAPVVETTPSTDAAPAAPAAPTAEALVAHAADLGALVAPAQTATAPGVAAQAGQTETVPNTTVVAEPLFVPAGAADVEGALVTDGALAGSPAETDSPLTAPVRTMGPNGSVAPVAPVADPVATTVPAEGKVAQAATPAVPATPADPKAGAPAVPATPAVPSPNAQAVSPAAAEQQSPDTLAGPLARSTAAPTEAPVAAPQSPAAVAAQPPLQAEQAPAAVAPAAPVAAPKPVSPMNQAFHAAETVQGLQDLAHVAATRGAARARLQLHPAELGAIDVRLKVTSEGLTAVITADRPEAVQALQQAGAELRKALEDRGLNVVSFDVDLASGQAGSQHDPAARDRTDGASTGRSTTGGTDAADELDGMEPDDHTTPTGVPAGALVDVLA